MAHAVAEHEHTAEHHPPEHMGLPLPNGKLAMWLFLVTEIMFFTALIGTYLILRNGTPANAPNNPNYHWPKPHEVHLVNGVLRILHNHLVVLDYGERDQLTGLLNRRTFEASFGKLRERTRELARTTGSGWASWLAVLDVDRFKSINDSHGHLFGDEVLLLLARLMNDTFRVTDQVFRFGGEEFVVVIDGADESGAARAFERFRAKVELFRFPQVGRATISIGYTQINPDDIPASAVARADAALYYAKQNGRNRLDCHESLVRAGLIARKEERSEVELF